jgi:hypothetical protein
MKDNHLTYYVTIYCGAPCLQNEVDYLQYGTFEEMLNFLEESQREYFASGYCAVVVTLKEGEEIDRVTVSF